MSVINSTEIWKQVPGYGWHYEASSHGRIRSKDRVVVKSCHGIGQGVCEQRYKGRLLKPCKSDKTGHLSIHISVNGKKHSVAVHKFVLLAFVGEKPESMECCHINGVAWDNRPENLRWDTHYENNQDRKKHGTYAVGEKHPMAKLTNIEVLEIRSSGLNGPQVAKKYRIDPTTAHKIITGRTWSHLHV